MNCDAAHSRGVVRMGAAVRRLAITTVACCDDAGIARNADAHPGSRDSSGVVEGQTGGPSSVSDASDDDDGSGRGDGAGNVGVGGASCDATAEHTRIISRHTSTQVGATCPIARTSTPYASSAAPENSDAYAHAPHPQYSHTHSQADDMAYAAEDRVWLERVEHCERQKFPDWACESLLHQAVLEKAPEFVLGRLLRRPRLNVDAYGPGGFTALAVCGRARDVFLLHSYGAKPVASTRRMTGTAVAAYAFRYCSKRESGDSRDAGDALAAGRAPLKWTPQLALAALSYAVPMPLELLALSDAEPRHVAMAASMRDADRAVLAICAACDASRRRFVSSEFATCVMSNLKDTTCAAVWMRCERDFTARRFLQSRSRNELLRLLTALPR